MRQDKERLLDILEAINVLEKNINGNKPFHQFDELMYLGIVRCLEIIGEAVRFLSDDIKSKHPAIPWKEIANMRNVLIHQYFDIDTEKVEKTIKEDIPKLKSEIQKILGNFN